LDPERAASIFGVSSKYWEGDEEEDEDKDKDAIMEFSSKLVLDNWSEHYDSPQNLALSVCLYNNRQRGGR
jgi:hypothetical protein